MADPLDPFDRASRYLLRQNDRDVLRWLLRLSPGALDFVQWLDTRRIPWPGQPERTCDTVAHVQDVARGGVPWAVVVEFQLRPDADMFGRALVYLGQLYLDLRPTPHPGDRFCVAAVVVNLTGNGASSRDFHWPEAGLRTTLLLAELNLAGLRAADVLDGVEAGVVPRAVLAWTPLMQGGDDSAVVQRWLAVAAQEPDERRRADLVLARLFAEPAGCKDIWKKALEGWNVIKSSVVEEWMDMGRIMGKVEAILEILTLRFGPLPADLVSALRDVDDPARLPALVALAVQDASIEQFRKDAGL